jgi:serine/threonine protein kinase/Tfp pilus assembly protein PilF
MYEGETMAESSSDGLTDWVGPRGLPLSQPVLLGEKTGEATARTLIHRFVEDMAQRWRRGERPLTEGYLDLCPALWTQPEAVMPLIYEEICLRQDLGQDAAAQEVVRRFPQWQMQLQMLLDCHQLLLVEEPERSIPAVGSMLGDFRLLAELGRGVRGQVFLATQPALADRPVVVKLIPRGDLEHLSLARLQHTHIVPLYSVTDCAAHALQALCMPYFGGTTLDRLLAALAGHPPSRRTGKDLVEKLRHAQEEIAIAPPVAGPACQLLERMSYVQAVCWLGALLADALQYAHEHGLVHLDVKPSNVLLAANGQPMLLDFHLARAPIPAGVPAPEWLGGTPGYVAPEQRAAMDAVEAGEIVPVAVDGRADVYALGVLLYEALGGTLPCSSRGAAWELRRRNPRVTVGLADLLDKCLAPNARDRYPQAAALATDLRRHLADLPLSGVRNRSPAERWRKWRRRRPYTLGLLGLLAVLVAGGALTVSHGQRRLQQAETALAEGRDHLRRHQAETAVSTFRRGLELAEDLPFHSSLVQSLRTQLGLAERVRAAEELHRFVERLRPHYANDSLPSSHARVLEAHCRRFWETRHAIAQRLDPQPEPGLDQQIHMDLLDLANLWTDLRMRLAAEPARADARREALGVLEQAEALFGPSCVLEQERQAHVNALAPAGVPAPADRPAAPAPRTAWEHYALGRVNFRAGDFERAAGHFERALELEPQGLWPNFYRGACAYHRAQYQDAVIAFSVCVALAPDRAWCLYNRGLAYLELGYAERALRDFDAALRLEPTLAAAAWNRGRLHYRQERYAEAAGDLQRALDNGASPAAVYYDLALVRLAQGERDAARTCLERVLEHDPDRPDARALRDRLRAEP